VFAVLASYPGLIPAHAIATFPGTVCVTVGSSNACPTTSITGPFGGTVTVAVNIIAGSDPFNAFDIRLKVDPGVLNASGVDLTGSVLPVDSTTLKAECINGAGFGCVGPLDGPGVVRVNVNATGTSTSGASGRFFAVTYQVVGLTTDSVIGYQTGCKGQFGQPSVCVTVTHPFTCFEGNCTTFAGEYVSYAVFGNLPTLVTGYIVTVTPSFTFNGATRMLSGTFAVRVANDTDGTVLFSKTFSVTVKVDSAGDARFLLVAPVSPAALAVGLSVDSNTSAVTGLVCGNPDVRNQGSVNIIDIASAAVFFGSTLGSPGYSLSLDLNRDGVISLLDLALIVSDYGLPAFR